MNEEYSRNCGVYILFVGDMFYIGKSIAMRSRFSAHRWMLTDLLYCEMINPNSEKYKLYQSYQSALQYLKENPDIDTIFAYVLEVCETDEEAYAKEQELISLMNWHFLGCRCFNVQEACDIFDYVSKEEMEIGLAID